MTIIGWKQSNSCKRCRND